MELGKPLYTDVEIKNYNEKSVIYSRIKHCIDNGERFAIPIESLQLFKHPVSITKLKEIEPKFSVPQCYLNIKNHLNIYSYLENQELYEKEYENLHEQIYENNFCMTCKEMETTDEFRQRDIQYLKKQKYNIIKAGYLTRR